MKDYTNYEEHTDNDTARLINGEIENIDECVVDYFDALHTLFTSKQAA